MTKAEVGITYRPPDLKDLPGFSVQEVRVAGNRSTCGGVEMALAAVSQIMDIVPQDVDVWTTHNPVNFPPAFEKYGTRLRNAQGDLSQVPDGAILIISAHGASPKIFDEAKQRNMLVINTTCSIVNDDQKQIRETAAAGIPSIFLGEKTHPETIGMQGQVDSEAITIFDPSQEIGNVSIPDGARIFAKTTNDPEQTDTRIEELLAINPTIDITKARSCYALRHRFAAGKALIRDVDFWLMVGDKSSHNARGLKSLAESRNIPSALVRGPEDIDWNVFGTGNKNCRRFSSSLRTGGTHTKNA